MGRPEEHLERAAAAVRRAREAVDYAVERNYSPHQVRQLQEHLERMEVAETAERFCLRAKRAQEDEG
jgi:hypothetical protein